MKSTKLSKALITAVVICFLSVNANAASNPYFFQDDKMEKMDHGKMTNKQKRKMAKMGHGKMEKMDKMDKMGKMDK
ncbi:MAG: hypothetical protein NVS3B19_03740 [Ginsengibacter sp.]